MMTDRITAGEIRAFGAAVPANVPDCATVSREGFRAASARAFAGAKMTVDGDTMHFEMSLDIDEPFQWVEMAVVVIAPPPANARILVSRNKREGGYLGRYRNINDPSYDFEQSPPHRHHRKGNSSWPTLREDVCHFYRDPTNDYHPPELVAFFTCAPLNGGAA